MRKMGYLLGIIFFPLAIMAKPFINIERWQTPNKVQVYFVKATQVPMVDIKIAFRAGSAFDGNEWGIAKLTSELINQGAGGLDATAIAENFENYGALYQASVNRDMATFSLRSLSEEKLLDPSVQNFTTILTQPDFKASDVTREKAQLVASIKQANESPNVVANNAFYKALYQNHPYAHPILGSIKTVQSLDSANIRNFYEQHYLAHYAVLAIVGDLSSSEAHMLAKRITEKLPNLRATLNVPETTSYINAEKSIQFPSKQTVIRLGQLGIRYDNPNYFPIIVGNYTLGGSGLVSRLAEEIREKRGLSYGVSSAFSPLLAKGPFVISLATNTPQKEQALNVTKETLVKFIKQGPSEKELTAAKKYLNGSFPLRLSSNRNVLNTILMMGFYNLPIHFLDNYLAKVNKVSTKDVKIAFQSLIHPNKLLQVTVGTK